MSDAQTHVALFNEAVRTGEWSAFLELFAPDAVMSFIGPPVGPYQGREAIAEGYRTRPPTDTMEITGVREDAGAEVVDFTWSRGGTGEMVIRRRDGLVTHLTIAFDV